MPFACRTKCCKTCCQNKATNPWLVFSQAGAYSLYKLLGLTSMDYFRSWWKAGVFCYIYAVTGGIHQYFVPSRTPAITDTFEDAIGFSAITIIWCLIAFIKAKSRKNGRA